ncbi:MAG: T9SS type A sorting domain-containing protein, partial [Bacteroidetes bacterium]|nr:T9SS type A sorting domain-containing protein [Bacteroidota bacterium]
RLLSTDCPADSLIGASVSDTITCANHNWTFTFNNLAAGTYYLPVPNFGFGQGGGAYNIAVSAVACANSNDLCTSVVPQALAVGASLTFTGDNSTATFDGDAVPGTVMAQYPAPNTWHAFTTTTCSNVTVSYCGTAAGWSNVWRLLSTDCPADSLIGASVSDTITCANHNWTFTFNNLAAGTYYLPVPNFGFGQGGGAYSIEVGAVTCAGANDLCTSVTPEALAIGSTLNFTGDNSTATFTGDAEPGTIMAQYPFPNTWHAFTTTACTDVTVSYCATDSGWSNVWRLLSTDCPADLLINASNADTTACANGNWTFSFLALAPGTYYLPVPNVGFGQGGGAYNINVSAAICTVGIPESQGMPDWTLYPNPSTGAVTVAFSHSQGEGWLAITDMTGRILISKAIPATGNLHLDLGGKLAPGQYLVEIRTSTGCSVQRLMLR